MEYTVYIHLNRLQHQLKKINAALSEKKRILLYRIATFNLKVKKNIVVSWNSSSLSPGLPHGFHRR